MGWKKGQSGNPKGRPRSGNSLAEAIRRTLDPDEVVAKLWVIAETSPSDQTKLRALEILLERGYKKPAQVIEVGPADPFEDMSEEELRGLLAEDDAQLAQLEVEGPALLEGLSAPVSELSSSGYKCQLEETGGSSQGAVNHRGELGAATPTSEGALSETSTTDDEESDT